MVAFIRISLLFNQLRLFTVDGSRGDDSTVWLPFSLGSQPGLANALAKQT